MRRVLVFGPSGAGKTTFAQALAERLEVPVVYLDAYHWQNGFDHEPEPQAWQERVARLAAEDAWVMDGNYASTLEPRLKACDAVVVLDYPRWLCLWSLVQRGWEHRGGKVRREMPASCVDRWSWEVAQFTWEYRWKRLPILMKRVAEVAPHVRVWRFTERRQAEDFLTEVAAP